MELAWKQAHCLKRRTNLDSGDTVLTVRVGTDEEKRFGVMQPFLVSCRQRGAPGQHFAGSACVVPQSWHAALNP